MTGVEPLVLVGPSGAGKTTIASRLVRLRPQEFVLSVSATTRVPRAGEKDGREYHFISSPRFEAMIADGELVEWARVHGRYYGTPMRNLTADATGGRTPVLDVDVNGARQISERVPDAVLVFVVPPDPGEWLRRLARRGTEPPEEIARRLRTALAELEAAPSFAKIVVNDDADRAAAEVLGAARDRSQRASAGDAGSARALCRRLGEGARREIRRIGVRERR